MKEKLYTIPVNDAFDQQTECPICAMKETLRKNAIEFTLGPSYMEDDVRMETNQVGFCSQHVTELYEQQNRLGTALMVLTHMDEVIKKTKEYQKLGRNKKASIFKKAEESNITAYSRTLKDSCYICKKIEDTIKYYYMTMFHLFRHDADFKNKLAECKGFCMEHYGTLYDLAPEYLNAKQLEEFTELIDKVFVENLQRVRDDLEWYTDKFDYRNTNAPWKNSKDALIRSILKMNGVVESKLVKPNN